MAEISSSSSLEMQLVEVAKSSEKKTSVAKMPIAKKHLKVDIDMSYRSITRVVNEHESDFEDFESLVPLAHSTLLKVAEPKKVRKEERKKVIVKSTDPKMSKGRKEELRKLQARGLSKDEYEKEVDALLRRWRTAHEKHQKKYYKKKCGQSISFEHLDNPADSFFHRNLKKRFEIQPKKKAEGVAGPTTAEATTTVEVLKLKTDISELRKQLDEKNKEIEKMKEMLAAANLEKNKVFIII